MVIDDAQIVNELMCLVPLRFGCRRLILAGDLNNQYNPFAEVYPEKILKQFNILGRMSMISSTISTLEIGYRRDHPIYKTLYNLEGETEIPTPEKEFMLIKKLLEKDIDVEENEIIVVGLLWKYTDIWKHNEATEFTVVNIDELYGVECDTVILPLWSVLSECNMGRMDIKKVLDKLEFIESRAKKEIFVIGEKNQIIRISEKWANFINDSKEQQIKK